MARTPLNLYRWGKSSSPALNKVRTKFSPTAQQYDVDAYKIDDVIWVVGRGGGVSCNSDMDGTFNGKGKWWLLSAGSTYDDALLYLYSPDEGGHWYWASEHDMRLDEYEEALAKMNDSFR
jgi:hypothetical protein